MTSPKTIVHCCCCARQVVSRNTDPEDQRVTTLINAKNGFGNQVICGHCATDLDENGLFPEEKEFLLRNYA